MDEKPHITQITHAATQHRIPLSDNTGARTNGLTIKERLFIKTYLKTLSHTQAARIAGYAEGYGFDLIRRPRIKREIDRRMERATMGATEVLARLAAQARSTVGDTLNESGAVDLDKARENGAMQHIKEIEYHENTGLPKKVKMVDSQNALQLLGKAHALFTDKVQTDTTIKIQVEAARSTMRRALADPEALAAMIAAAQAVGEVKAQGSTPALPAGVPGVVDTDAREVT